MSLAVLLGVAVVVCQAAAPLLPAQLRSEQVAVRAWAVTTVRSQAIGAPGILDDVEVQRAAIATFSEETDRIERNLEAYYRTGVTALSEDFAEYYAELQEIVLLLLDRPGFVGTLRGRALSELIRSTYNPGSPLVMRLAKEGAAVVPEVLRLNRSSSSSKRANAYSLIRHLFREAESDPASLGTGERDQLRQAARGGLRDAEAEVRRFAIGAVVAGKDVEAIPILEHLAQDDPDSGLDQSPVLQQNSVRTRAAQAVTVLSSLKK